MRIPGVSAGLVQVCLAGVLWGTGGLAVQLVRRHAELSALTISGWRTGLAALSLLVAVVVLRRGADVRALLLAHPVRSVVVGLFTAAYQALYFAAVVLVGVTVSTVVSLGLAPVLLTVVDVVRRRARPTRHATGPVAVALVGLLLVSGTAGLGTTGPHPLLGVLASIASGTAYAVATLLGETVARGAEPLALTAVATTAGALVLVPLALVVAGLRGEPVVTADPRALVTLVYLGVVTMALAYALLYAGLRTTSSSAAVLATLLEPVTAAVVAAVVLGEALGPLGIAGTVLVLVAVALSGRGEPGDLLGAGVAAGEGDRAALGPDGVGEQAG